MDLDAHKRRDSQISIRLPAELVARLTALARRRGIARASLVLELIRDGVKRLEDEARSK